MEYYITNIKDTVGNNYLGIKMYPDSVSPFLSELKDHLSDDYDDYVNNQKSRDRESYHITVINVMEYNSLVKSMGMSNFVSSIESVLKFTIDDLKLLGLGSASRGENTTYFVVCKSDKIDSIRDRYDLPKHDLHITLGFKWKDVFGVPKNQILKPKSKFIKLLKSEFYKRENFNFIDEIGNFQESDGEIIPVSLSETIFEFISGDKLFGVGILDDEKLWVMYSSESTSGKKRLPLSEIIRVFNQN